jgi:predicted transcriptional regulator
MPRRDLPPSSPHRATTRPASRAETAPVNPVPPRKGGRPKAFSEDTVKVALFLPPDLIGTLKALAARRRLTPSLVVAEWIEKAEIREAITRGQRDFEKGDVVSHEEAVQRLARW